MKHFFISFLLLGFSFISDAQIKDANLIIKDQAILMGQAFISEDYKTFTKYNNPTIIKMMGGQEKMVASMLKIVSDMKSKGMFFKSFTFDEPSKIVKSGKELQCTLAQHTYINTPSGGIVSNSTLIAISTDSGQKWTFIDTNNKDMATIRRILPNLSSAITILPKQQEVQ